MDNIETYTPNDIEVQQFDTNSSGLTPLEIYKQKLANGEVERGKQKSLKEKWEGDKTSLRKSISYMCYQCMGGRSSDNLVKDIRECTSKDCALHCVRPYK